MLFGYTMLFIAITISAIAAWYSIAGLTAIFAAAVIPVIIMGGALEAGKIIATVFLHNQWKRISWLYKTYLIPAIVFLMLLTSMGIFGFLSKAHSDQGLVSGDASSKVAIYDEKIIAERENIASAKKALEQMNSQVDQMMGRTDSDTGAQRAVNIRKSQTKERNALQADITKSQKNIQSLQEQRAPLAAELRKIEAEVGPIKYIAAFIYGDDPDQNVLEKAVRWVIILIVIVFDPLALCLILASNKQLEWAREDKSKPKLTPEESHNIAHEAAEEIIGEVKPFFAHAGAAAQTADFLDEQQRAERANAELAALPVEQTAVIAEPEHKNEELNIPVLENEEMWAQRVIDELPVTESNALTVEENVMLPVELPSTMIKQIEDTKPETVELLGPNVQEVLEPSETAVEPKFDNHVDKIATIVDKEITVDATQEVALDAKGNLPEYVSIQGKSTSLAALRGANPGLYRELLATADNGVEPTVGFGTEFPRLAKKSDVFTRVDVLPNRVYKFNGQRWIEMVRDQSQTYLSDNKYIQHLVSKLQTGEYDFEWLTDDERVAIETFLSTKNA
jgi:cytochrome c oxidase subunit IV